MKRMTICLNIGIATAEAVIDIPETEKGNIRLVSKDGIDLKFGFCFGRKIRLTNFPHPCELSVNANNAASVKRVADGRRNNI